MELTSSTYIASSDNQSYLVKFGELVYFMDESFDMFMIKTLTTITKSLTREFEKETHKRDEELKKKKQECRIYHINF